MSSHDSRDISKRSLVLSPTKINTFLACRLMFRFTYLMRLSRFYYVPRAEHSFGAALHRAINEFHRAGGAETQSADQLAARIRDNWVSAGFESEEAEREYMLRAETYLREYHTVHRLERARTLFTEKQLRCNLGDFTLMGRIDRIDEHADGRIEVIDYKSGRLSVSEEDVLADLAMGVYACLAHRHFPGRQICATIFALRTAERATACFSEDQLASVENAVRSIAREIADTDWESVDKPVFLPEVCPRCNYLRLCARRAGWNVLPPDVD